MRYMGSKRRIASKILPIILKNRQPGQFYIEPFMGGCNSLCEVTGNRIGNDLNHYVVAMFEALTNGWIPPDIITEGEYDELKKYKDILFDAELVGFVGFGVSFSGNFFSSIAKDKAGIRNYCKESKNRVLKQAEKLKGTLFISGNYDEIDYPENSIIYCDPPYKGTAEYKDKGFNHFKFWQWVRYMVKKGHSIFVSEYTAPDDFACVWSHEIVNGLNKKSHKAVEKLFVHSSTIDLW